MAYRPPRPPGDLQQAGQDLWKSIVKTNELAPHELRILREACKGADMEGLLESDIIMSPSFKTTGSMGQEVLNDSVKEWRMYSKLVVDHLLKLKLEHAPGAVQGTTKTRQAAARSAHSRQAARARWEPTTAPPTR